MLRCLKNFILLKNPGKKVPVRNLPIRPHSFKHVVYIIKENRTYDQVFGDMPQGDSDTSLVEFGKSHLIIIFLLKHLSCSMIFTAAGFFTLMATNGPDEAYVTDYLEKSFGGFTHRYPMTGTRCSCLCSSGFIWDNVLRHGLTFRNYGEFVNAVIEPSSATFADIYRDFMEGTQ